jgi:hypothetical protein
MKIYKLCDYKGYVCNMTVYLGKDWKCVTATVTTTDTILTDLTARIENVGHKLVMDSL